MAKQVTTKTPPPTSLTMRLGAPGMSPLHRAGLGGLAATLNVLDALRKKNPDEAPFTSPLWREDFRWEVTKTEVTLHFGEPQNAAPFLEWLFQFAFGLQDGLIFLPGQYRVGNSPPPVEERARLQDGITLTFLQFGKTRALSKERATGRYDHGGKELSFEFSNCSRYAQQSAWNDYTKANGELVSKLIPFRGTAYPGAIVRHESYSQTQIAQPVSLVLPLHFALVGTLSLPLPGNRGVLIVPHIDDLITFAKNRWRVTPYSSKEMRVASLGDAALQFEIRQRSGAIQNYFGNTGCDVIQLHKLPWSGKQKFRSAAYSVAKIDDETLDFYNIVMEHLSPRIAEKKESVKEGRGKNAVTSEVVKRFWTDSVVRPFIADNLAQGKHWFTGFRRLITPADKTMRDKINKNLGYEEERINNMIHDDRLDWKLEGAKPLVLAVQEALRHLYGKAGGLGKRLDSEYDKWRLAFSGAKTAERFRYALSDMFSRAKSVPSLQADWESVTKLLLTDWEAARDLALIGLASYKGKSKDEPNSDDNADSE